MSKKIGILTLPLIANYGGILQCMALYGFLKSKGYEVVLLNNRPCFPKWKKMAIKLFELLPFQNYKGLREQRKKNLQFRRLIDSYFDKKTKPLLSKKDFLEFGKECDFDALVVGSDQVWRYEYINDGYYERYFLDFLKANSIKRIAYAASFGKNQIDERIDLSEHSPLLGEIRKFHSISVRESEGVNLCRDFFFRRDAGNVLDPTLLVGVEFYDKFLSQGDEKNKAKIVSYVLDKSEEKDDITNYIKDKINSKSEKGDTFFLNEKLDNRYLSIEEWLQGIKYSKFVVTDSFHGVVFSILFNKQFIVLANLDRGLDRFSSILRKLNLEERLLLSMDYHTVDLLIDSKIDYGAVNKVLEIEREKSKKFLIESIEDF